MPHTRPGGNSRRGFLKDAAALAVTTPAFAQAGQSGSPPKGRILTYIAYVGTYSSPQGPEGSKGRGQGIYLFHMNPSNGALTEQKLSGNDANPAWLAFNPSRTHLYSANETTTFKGKKSGSISAYSIDRATGNLTPLNTVSSEGAGPAHMSIHPSGRYALVANYAGGTVAVIAIESDGKLGRATDVKSDTGPVGPEHATSAPAGSFAISGHDHPHAHMIESDPSGRFVVSSDLGMDRLLVWKFDANKGTLNDPVSVPLPPGDGPRHFAFHPNRRWFYSLQEEASTLVLFDFDSRDGKMTQRQTLSTLPKAFRGTNFTSEVTLSADARFVYAANRLHDSIAWFSIGNSGELTLLGEEWTRGDYPRSFNIDPTGNFLYSCNQRGDAITTFRVNRKTGALTFTGQYTAVGTPAYICFLT